MTRSRLPPAWIGGVLGVGIILSTVLYLTIRGLENTELQEKAESIAQEQTERLKAGMMRSMDVLYSIAALHAAEGEIRRPQFQQFVQQAISRQPELQAVSWNPRVRSELRAVYEAKAVADGFNQFRFQEKNAAGEFIPARSRPEYVPVYFIEPLDRNVSALGYDLASDAQRRGSFEQARDTGEPVATEPIHLAQEPRKQTGLLVLLPVYDGVTPKNTTQRREQLAGFAVAVFRMADLVGRALQDLREKGIDAQLYADTPEHELIYAAPDSSSPSTKPPGGAEVRLEIASRRWAVAFAPTKALIAGQSHQRSRLALLGGLVFTLLTTAYLYGGWRRTREVAQANRALEEEIRVRQKAEAAAAAANSAKTGFLASMSHEIRTPLNAILGYTQLMQRDPAMPLDQRDSIRGISTSGQHLLGLIDEILDLSKIEAGRMELNAVDFDLAALGHGLASTFQSLCAQKRIGFRFEMGGAGEARVCGDEGKLRQILINLAGNAIKFTTAGEVFLHFKPGADGQWLFEVIDTGLGIPVAEQAAIFKPFHQGSGARHQGGTGLGIAIAQRQVQLLGGTLELQSERGIGSRFYFCIPLPQAQSVSTRVTQTVRRLRPGMTVRALVVDDSLDNRKVLGGMLSAVGCEVSFAEDGLEALDDCRERHPAIIFLDLLMPGLDGVGTARAILDDPACGSPKIVAHTASPLARIRDSALAAGCVDFLAKPFRCERLYECLERHLGVEFDRDNVENETETLRPASQIHVSLPGELYARLTVAAELHSTTALKHCLQELGGTGPDGRQLAEHIRLLMRSYNMGGILQLLSHAASPGTAAAPLTNAHEFAAS